MRRAFPILFTALIAACFVCGCSTTGGAKSVSTDAGAEVQDDAAKKEVAEENPLKPDVKDEAAVADASSKSGSSDKDDDSATKETKGHSHDASTLALIEQELKDATPKERDDLFNDLKGLEPQMVRLVLNARRSVRQIGQMSEESSSSEVASHHEFGSANQSSGAIMPAGGVDNRSAATVAGVGYSGSQGSRFGASPSSTGMGTANPWGQPHQAVPPNPYQAHHINNQAAQQSAPWNAADGHGQAAAGDQWPTVRSESTAFSHGGNMNATMPQFPGSTTGDMSMNSRNPGSTNHNVAIAGRLQNHNRATTRFASSNTGSQSVSPLPASGANWSSLANRSASSGNGTSGMPAMQAVNGQPTGTGPWNQSNTMNTTFGMPHYQANQNAFAAEWNDELQRLIAMAADAASRMNPGTTPEETRAYVEKQVHLRMLYLMAGQPERAFEPIHGIEPADQEFWLQLLWGVASYFDSAIADPSDRAAQTVAQLRTSIEKLQESAKLDLRNVTFCHKIDSFGDYERFSRDEFTPGQPVLVYAEVANFKSEQAAQGQFRTILRSTVDIYKAGPSGDLIESIPFQPTEDLCRNYRRDYFHSYEFTIPQRIGLGPHVIKLTVEDQLSRKIATYSLNFTVK